MATTKQTGNLTQSIESASAAELQKLIAKATEELKEREREKREEKKAAKKKARREVVGEAAATGNGTYQWEMIRCGEETCKCANGKAHGPYLYLRGVRNDKKGRRSIYIPLRDVSKHPQAPARPSPE